MKRFLAPLSAVLFSALSAQAANRDIQDLQRDVAQLQESVRGLQRTLDEKFAAIQTLIQATLETANRSNSALGGMDALSRNNMQALQDKVVSPVVGVGAKVDSMSNDMGALRESVTDLTARMNRIQQQLTDLSNVMKAVQTPAAPPPTSGTPQAGSYPQPTGSESSSGPPPVKATVLYDNARRDMTSGKADLALSEFQDYVKYYNNTDLAPNAQFYIGQIRYTQRQFDLAIQEFDKVLEAYPDNNKTPDAHYMKGKTLFQLGQRTAAAKEFQAVVSDFPNSSVAPSAREQLKVLGINTGAPAATRRRR